LYSPENSTVETVLLSLTFKRRASSIVQLYNLYNMQTMNKYSISK